MHIEKVLSVILIGLNPPVPPELEPDFLEKNADAQRELRRAHLKRVFRWQVVISGVIGIMIIKWLWECGILAMLGLGFSLGFAHASDVEKVQKAIEISAAQQNAKLDALLTKDIVDKISIYRARKCKAITDGDQEEEDIFDTLISDETDRYKAITKREYIVRACPASPSG